MSRPDTLSERAIILAPYGRDGQIASRILMESGFPAVTHTSLGALCAEIEKGAGLAVLAEEAVHGMDLRPLTELLAQQPAWSDLPIILMTQRGSGAERAPAASRLGEILGNVIFLERPFHPTTLVSAVRTAVRSRRRQYQARTHLEDLREGEQRLQTALKAGRLGSWTFDVRRKRFDASEACKGHFGHRADDAFSFDDLLAAVHPDDQRRLRSSLAQTLSEGKDYRIEFRNVWPDGTVHWVDVRARALSDDGGEVAQLIGVSSDITLRKTSELERERLLADLASERSALADLTLTLEQRVSERTAQLTKEVAARQRAQEQLLQSQKMESIGQLTGGVAHDFNNLLMAVMANLELLRKRSSDDSRALHLIDGALQGAQRGASLTQRMLAFARQQDLRTSSADISALLLGMQELLQRTLTSQIALRFEVPKGLPPVQVDAHQIELAILNLVINGRDAMPDGGTITITVDEKARSASKREQRSPYLRLRVTDTGHGMDEEILKKAIEPFFSTKPVGKGTGLGLSMVHGLAVQLGGLLELSSRVGKGTTATLWLPLASGPATEEAGPAASTESGHSATILLVDDDPLIAMSTADMLEDLGHQVIQTHSAAQALEILEKGQAVDLIMTDQAMPGMTGIEFAEIVRGRMPLMPILLATGYAELPVGQTLNLPRLAKPYRQEQLQAEIDRLLQEA